MITTFYYYPLEDLLLFSTISMSLFLVWVLGFCRPHLQTEWTQRAISRLLSAGDCLPAEPTDLLDTRLNKHSTRPRKASIWTAW